MELKPCSANDLISKSALLEKQECVGISDAQGNYYGYCDVVFVTDINTAPTVDAVPVVRCRECCYSDCAYEGAQRCCRTPFGERIAVEDMGFCSRGERE